ncbi:FeoA family protein [Luteitalea sp.]|uniref:FeoA family protein n=1 Tax=Luteitalea sp. TaxID=2004800 RepID=UPI0025C24EA1|nr:FeoA family protein [Luteitalea sp.]
MTPPVTSAAPPRPAAAVPLTTVPVGVVATLHEVTDADSRPVLRSLGLTDDCVLRLCQVGDPCIVQVKSTRIGLSSAVARCLYVVPEPGNR